MVTHSNVLAWEIPWTEEAGGLNPMGHKRVRYNLATKTTTKFNRDIIKGKELIILETEVMTNFSKS